MTFVVGLDAERFPGAGIQDPILLDDDRRRLKPGALPGIAEILEERRYANVPATGLNETSLLADIVAWTPASAADRIRRPLLISAILYTRRIRRR